MAAITPAEAAELPNGFLFPLRSGSALCTLPATYSTTYMVNNLRTQNLGQMKVRKLADIKYFQKEMDFWFVWIWFGL